VGGGGDRTKRVQGVYGACQKGCMVDSVRFGVGGVVIRWKLGKDRTKRLIKHCNMPGHVCVCVGGGAGSSRTTCRRERTGVRSKRGTTAVECPRVCVVSVRSVGTLPTRPLLGCHKLGSHTPPGLLAASQTTSFILALKAMYTTSRHPPPNPAKCHTHTPSC